MTMLSKLSIVSTMAALLFSFNASAMSDQEQGKCLKQEKGCLEEECDQFQEKCDLSDKSQSLPSCSSSQSQAGQSLESCSSQQSCGATVNQDCLEQISDKHWLHKHWKAVDQMWFTKIRGRSLVGTRGVWHKAVWTNMGSKDVRLERIALDNSRLDNVYLNGKFNHVSFDGSEITNSTFSGKFSDTDFKNATLTNVVFESSKFEKHHEHVPFVGRRSNFDLANLTNVTFLGDELKDMTFRDAFLNNVSFPCSQIGFTTCFEDANVNVNGRWVKLNGTMIKKLGGSLSSCKESSVNLSAWIHTNHPMW